MEEGERGFSIPAAVIIACILVGGAFFLTHRGSAPVAVPDDSPQPTLKKEVPAPSASDHMQGDLKAPVKIIEYIDFESPFSKAFDPALARALGEYPGKVAWIVREFPLEGLHPNASRLALAAECAASLGGNDAFWKFKDTLFATTSPDGSFDITRLSAVAEEAGLDPKAFDGCVAAGTYADAVTKEFEDVIAAGGSGSPWSVLVTGDGTQVPIAGAQSYENLKAAIDAALNG
jgi:protein-disulfide isomerase